MDSDEEDDDNNSKKSDTPSEDSPNSADSQDERFDSDSQELFQLQDLVYNEFPTMLGWYFDGFYQPRFSMGKEYADIFNAVKEEMAHRKQIDPKETFTEKQRRHFWPPRVFGNFFFRGRGWYCDLREVSKDPPRIPENKEEHFQKGEYPIYPPGNREEKFSTSQFKYEVVHRHDFYFDSDFGQWYPKGNEDPNILYYDFRFRIWRIKRYYLKYALGDWWFDDTNGKFSPKDPSNPFQYYYDGTFNVWKKFNVKASSSALLQPKDYFYDELKSEWILKKSVDESTYAFDENGWRFAKRISLPGPDDYYFDDIAGDFVLKEIEESRKYVYDAKMGAWRMIGSGTSKPKCPMTPWEFYWHEQTGTFRRKDAPRSYFEFDENNRFYRRKKVLIGRQNPRNWAWNEGRNRNIWAYSPKHKRSRLFSRRPAKDYDTPWLDYYQVSYHPEVKEWLKAKDTKEEGDQHGPPTDYEGKYGRRPMTLDEILISEGMLHQHRDFGHKDEKIITEQVENETESSVDRRRLKCANLKGLISAKEIKAYFTSALEVVAPKENINIKGDFYFIRFPSEEAAVAAYRTMQHVEIKGQKIELSYPMRYEI